MHFSRLPLLYYTRNLIHKLKLTRQSSAKFCKLVRSTRIPVAIVVAIVFRASIEITYPSRAWARIKANSPARICDRATSFIYASTIFINATTATTSSRKHFARRVKFCSPSFNPFIGGRARALSHNSPVTKLNLLVANMMENGYANTAECSGVASLPHSLSLRRRASKIKTKRTGQGEIFKLLRPNFNLCTLSLSRIYLNILINGARVDKTRICAKENKSPVSK